MKKIILLLMLISVILVGCGDDSSTSLTEMTVPSNSLTEIESHGETI